MQTPCICENHPHIWYLRNIQKKKKKNRFESNLTEVFSFIINGINKNLNIFERRIKDVIVFSLTS